MPLQLTGDRFIHVTPALPGWGAVFRTGVGDELEVQPVVAWAVVEVEQLDNKDRAVARAQETVAIVCGGPAGLINASAEEGYLGVTGPGESGPERLLRFEKEANEAEAAEAASAASAPPGKKAKGTGTVSLLRPTDAPPAAADADAAPEPPAS